MGRNNSFWFAITTHCPCLLFSPSFAMVAPCRSESSQPSFLFFQCLQPVGLFLSSLRCCFSFFCLLFQPGGLFGSLLRGLLSSLLRGLFGSLLLCLLSSQPLLFCFRCSCSGLLLKEACHCSVRVL